jgi:hypothetical protein
LQRPSEQPDFNIRNKPNPAILRENIAGAHRALEDCLRDEPDWQDILSVVGIELDGLDMSPN